MEGGAHMYVSRAMGNGKPEYVAPPMVCSVRVWFGLAMSLH